jgi:hypothetical protein
VEFICSLLESDESLRLGHGINGLENIKVSSGSSGSSGSGSGSVVVV